MLVGEGADPPGGAGSIEEAHVAGDEPSAPQRDPLDSGCSGAGAGTSALDQSLAGATAAPRSRLRLVFRPRLDDSDKSASESQSSPPLVESLAMRPPLIKRPRALSAPRDHVSHMPSRKLKSDPRFRVLCAERGNTGLPPATTRKKARKTARAGAQHAVAGSNAVVNASMSLSFRLSEGRITQCACCRETREASLLAQAPLVLHVHDLLTSRGATLDDCGIPARQRLYALFLRAFGGSDAASPEERLLSLRRYLADELLNRRAVAVIRNEGSAERRTVIVTLLVSSQQAIEVVEHATATAAREARRLAAVQAIGGLRAHTRVAAGSRPTEPCDDASNDEDDDDGSADHDAEDDGGHDVKPPSASIAATATLPFAVSVVLCDISELTPVPELLRAPSVDAIDPGADTPLDHGEAHAASEGRPVDEGPPAMATEPATDTHKRDRDNGMTATSKASHEHEGSLRMKRAPKPASVSRSGAAGATTRAEQFLTPLHGPLVLPTGAVFSADDAMRLMLRLRYTAPIVVTELPDRGRCVFSNGFIPRGAFVTEYAGQLIPHAEARDREAQYRFVDRSAGCYMFFFSVAGRAHCVDATAERPQYGVGRLVSHSRRSPTCIIRRLLVDGIPRLALVAARDIMYGEELSYDYGDTSAAAARAFEWLKKA